MSKPLLTDRVDKDEFNDACRFYTIDEVMKLFSISSSGLRKLSRIYGGRPLKLCRRCKQKYTPPDSNSSCLCPDCREGILPSDRNKKIIDCGVRYGCKVTRELENEARYKGLSYADIQKQRTLEMVGKINLGDVK